MRPLQQNAEYEPTCCYVYAHCNCQGQPVLQHPLLIGIRIWFYRKFWYLSPSSQTGILNALLDSSKPSRCFFFFFFRTFFWCLWYYMILFVQWTPLQESKWYPQYFWGAPFKNPSWMANFRLIGSPNLHKSRISYPYFESFLPALKSSLPIPPFSGTSPGTLPCETWATYSIRELGAVV